MRRPDKLYTVNRWNSPLLCSGGRLFENGGGMEKWNKLAEDDRAANPWNYTEDGGTTTEQYMQSKNKLGISKIDNPLSKGNIKGTMGGIANGVAGAVGGLLNKGISGGYSSGAGKAIGSIGSTIGGAVGTINPIAGTAITLVSQGIGGITNAIVGTKVNQEALNQANATIAAGRNFVSTADNFDDMKGLTAQKSFKTVYSGGLAKKGWARKKNAALKAEVADANSFVDRSIANNVTNIASDLMGSTLASYAAYGGPLTMIGNDMGATEYGLASDYLSMKNRQAQNKNNMIGYLGASNSIPTLFALGGDMQSNGADWSTGLGHIAAGGTHEENPYEGVPMGIAPDGQPNLVEEGETVYNDYVFSNRLKPTKEVLRKFHLSTKNTKLTYADVSKKLEKEALERPNDPLSQAALKKLLDQLAECQEQQRAEEQAKEALEAFKKLSPEEQQQVMEQIIAQQQQGQMDEQQMTEQQAMEQQATQQQQEVPVDENGNPIDSAMMQQQGDVQYAAYGGHLGHRFKDGGDTIKEGLSRALNLLTDSDWNKFLSDNNISEDTEYNRNENLLTAISKINPSLAYVLRRGYDFGAYVPDHNNNGSYDFTNGAWGSETSNDWYDSRDAAWQEIMSNPTKYGLELNRLSKDNSRPYNSEELGEAIKKTDAYKRGTAYLKADPKNMLKYLQAIYNSKDAPEDAKRYAGKFVDEKGWLPGVTPDYTTIFEGSDGQGVRVTHPGTFWKTPDEVAREKQVVNYIQNADGSIEQLNYVPTGWTPSNTYSWSTPTADVTNSFYIRPVDPAATTAGVTTEEGKDPKNPDNKTRKIRYKDDKGRDASILGPILSTTMWLTDVGKPDTSGLDAAMNYARNADGRATYKNLDNYIKPDLTDIFAELNRLDASTNATNRAIMNSGSTAGGKNAAILASEYNHHSGSADIYKKAKDYNWDKKYKSAEFNRGTEMFNAEAFNKTSQLNAELRSKNAQFNASLAADIARQKMAARNQWYNALYSNLSNLFTSISNKGRENAQHNMIAAMVNNDVFGTPGSEAGHMLGDFTDQSYIGMSNDGKKNRAHGGKIRRRKGFTI